MKGNFLSPRHSSCTWVWFVSSPGGRSDKATTKSLLNDKRLVKEQRERYNQYSVIVEEVPEPGGGDLFSREDYEDEYDDTYDDNQVGANDADSDDELISRR